MKTISLDQNSARADEKKKCISSVEAFLKRNFDLTQKANAGEYVYRHKMVSFWNLSFSYLANLKSYLVMF